ncbi:hypothetical protein [Streptomyces griseus]|uniref:hypothetical protein n=1 Tax=Streptomyces griseus TaxID=1911 RepID=UPI0005622757|nr:hypothetical protein [Streptomyces griseus]
MSCPPARAVVMSSALALTALLTVTACSADGSGAAAAASPRAGRPSAASPSPAGAPALTAAQAQAALVTAGDLGEPWTPTQGAATWRDGLLKASADVPDCGRLLDALYAEELFGPTERILAVSGLDDDWYQAQLHYQVITQAPAEVDRTLAWLRTLPRTCAEFRAKAAGGRVQSGTVEEAGLPDVGDARQALRVTLGSETPDGDYTELTVYIAAVRVGDDTITVTNGGVGEVYESVTRAAVEIGAARVAEVRRQGRKQV